MTEQVLFVLAALSAGELHGYGIAREVEELSGGEVRLAVGTLYGVLSRLSEQGLIEQTREVEVSGRRRRYYVLTGLGETALREEIARMHATANALGSRVALGVRPRPGTA
ncbi:MAG: PadR family transcriptional regulator [Angustibacter sp.]